MEDNRLSQISIPENGEDQFPIGLKVLAIDNNIVCLKYLVQLLQKCQYKVTATTEAAEAIRLVKDEKETFDIIITNVVRHDIDGFKILASIGLEMDIPVVMVSAYEELEMVKRAVMEGAEAYLLKPVRLQELRNIWQHVLRKRSRKTSKPNVLEQKKPINSHERATTITEDDDNDKNINLDDISIVASSSSSKRKPRVIWTKELHDKFVGAYEQLREKERVPRNILTLMNDPSLSRQHVASHLQKYRGILRKKMATRVEKLASQKNYDHRNPTKASTIYHSIYQRNKVSNLRPQLPVSDLFQFPNRARSSMEQLQINENPRSTWMAAGSYSPVPDFQWFNNFPSNDWIPKARDQYLRFGTNNTNSYYPQYPLESQCLNSASQTFGNSPIDNVGVIPDQAAPLAGSLPNISTDGQCSQMQFDKENSLTDDELSAIIKQFPSEGPFWG